MNDQASSTQAGGTNEPHCLFTVNGSCAITNTLGWAETLNELADQTWEENVDSIDHNNAIETGEAAAKIKATADEAWEEACEMKPCANCPRRREIGG
ncbi:MAG: hypothetical protein Q8L37_04970 [Candidatus Gottesmanbacteria bacterium]|nr:hypothetical protein [Candidatus Gottesmanbacteria bacterium]